MTNGNANSNGNGNGNGNSYKHKVVYTIIETGEGKSIWRRVGAAFINRDDSLTVLLDALPVNGRLHIREPNERDEKQASAA